MTTNESLARNEDAEDRRNLAAQIHAFASVLRRAARESLVVRVNLHGATVSDALDATQFKAALLNLVVNAREAMPGRSELTLSAGVVDLDSDADVSPRLAAGRYAAVSVTDQGNVMPVGTDDFGQTRGGIGLALSQVQGFATQSGGGIGIVTTADQGTSVTIYLPVEVVRDDVGA